MRIVVAMVNPAGPGDEGESVLLLNASPEPVDLTGWQIADKAKEKCAVPTGTPAAGGTQEVPVARPCALQQRQHHHSSGRDRHQGLRRLLHQGAGPGSGLDGHILSDPAR